MNYQTEKFEQLVHWMDRYSALEGLNPTSIESFGTFKASNSHSRLPSVDFPAIMIVGQGKKYCFVGGKKYNCSAGNVVIVFYPMAVEAEIVEASPVKPFLAAGVVIDMGRISDLLLRIDRIDGAAVKPQSIEPSGLYSLPLNDHLLDPFIRLFDTLDNPRDSAILGDAIVDEIYYRILCDEQGDELRYFLQQRGEIQRISRAVGYIHQNLNKPVSVEELADMVHMSRTTFYENFKDVMHMSPLQYAKSIKLDRAQALIKEGKKANEAGYLVGYNSPAQFSREYKRHFGYTPSAT